MMHDTILNQPVVCADWFDLRPLRKSDQGSVQAMMSEKRLAQMTAKIPHPLPSGAATDFVMQSMSEDRVEDVWAMDASRSDGAAFMGLITLQKLDQVQAEISYWVAPEFWNKGVAQAAVRAMVVANPLGNRTLFASVFQENLASAKVVTNCGFEYLGDAESFCVARNAAVPTWTYIKKLN